MRKNKNKKYEINCIICDKKMEFCFTPSHTDAIDAISGGLICRIFGNYGSSLYDPISTGGSEFLEFYICDECLKKKEKSIYWKRFSVKSANCGILTLERYIKNNNKIQEDIKVDINKEMKRINKKLGR